MQYHNICNLLNPDCRAIKLGMVMLEYGFEKIINGPTWVTQITETQIDLLFTTNPDLIEYFRYRELKVIKLHNWLYYYMGR